MTVDKSCIPPVCGNEADYQLPESTAPYNPYVLDPPGLPIPAPVDDEDEE